MVHRTTNLDITDSQVTIITKNVPVWHHVMRGYRHMQKNLFLTFNTGYHPNINSK